jgi:large subunit ribosomal protein L6
MSRISKKPLIVPKNIKFKLLNNKISFIGKHGELSYIIDQSIDLNIEKNIIFISTNKKKNNAILGLTKILLTNMVIGVDIGFEKKLKLIGVGYKAKIKDNLLELHLGFSHIVKYIPKKGINITCNSNTELTIFGINKQLVGQTAAEIRLIRPPEPYKGKGIRYIDEHVRIKDSKKK